MSTGCTFKFCVSTIISNTYDFQGVLRSEGVCRFFLSIMLFGAISISQLPVGQLKGCGRLLQSDVGCLTSHYISIIVRVTPLLLSWYNASKIRMKNSRTTWFKGGQPSLEVQSNNIFQLKEEHVLRKILHDCKQVEAKISIPLLRDIQPLLSECSISPSRRGHCRSCCCRPSEGHPESH